MIYVDYVDRKGTGRGRTFPDADKAAMFLSTLRLNATARDSQGFTCGGVRRKFPDSPVDRRTKWLWWIDRDAV